MDKKINKKINIIESSCVLFGILCMSIAAVLHVNGIGFLKPLFMIISSIIEFVVVAIELFLFYLENKKYRFITSSFYVLEVLLLMFLNIQVPFAGLVVVAIFSILKNVFRVMKVEEIYQPLGYYELCKKYGIKVKKPRKARVSATKKSTVPVKNRKKRSVKEEPTFA